MMKSSTMRGNLLILAGLYGISLAVACGCPAAGGANPEQRTSPASDPPRSALGSQKTKSATDTDKSKPPFDPIQVNGKYFEGWKKPKVALLISGRQDGYLEPCGCAGLENQKGGLNRRYTLIKQLTGQGWPVVPLDVGNLVRRYGKQSEIQYSISAEALKKMGYQAVGFGSDDLRLPAGEVAAAIAGPEAGKSIFVSANVNLFGLNAKYQIIEMAGMKIGVTAVFGADYQKDINNSEIEISPAAEALSAVVAELKDCDRRVLLAFATSEESKQLAKKFPQFDFVVTSGGAEEPPNEAAKIEGAHGKLIEVGHKGMFVIVLGLYDDPKQPVRYQRVALDSRYKNSQEMQQLLATYEEQLRELGWAGLGLRSVAHPRSQKGDKLAGQFAGAASCKTCHPTAWGVWSKSKHAEATATLTKLTPPRQYDPECISCHSTGWNPQEYFPYASGFDSLQTTPHLAGNSCENCHGPGAAHVAAETGKAKPKEREDLRAPLRLTTVIAEKDVCRNCHDLDNSPEFNFEKYWPKVQHKGKR